MKYKASLQIFTRAEEKIFWGLDVWITRSVIIQCPCGDKYIKTRDGQDKCHVCMGYVDKRTRANRLDISYH